MLDMSYRAHIVTDLEDPEVTVFAARDGERQVITSYPLAGDVDPYVLLGANGWRGDKLTAVPADHGCTVVEVEPVDWAQIVAVVTLDREIAEAERQRCDIAWRTVIASAMTAGHTTKSRIAEAAGISRERAYQIRDGRR
jgi:hypothetical protein